MIFNKKKNKDQKCEGCGYYIKPNFSFCPQCGNSLRKSFKDQENYGLLGKDDFSEQETMIPQNLGITDKMINSIFNSMMKSLDKQFKNQMRDIDQDLNNAEIKSLPNGIRIKISGPFQNNPQQKRKTVKKKVPTTIDENQIQKMNTLPRGTAKTSVKRLGDKVIYELAIPGVSSPKDIFVSKLESGYEIKAIGNKKVYVNSVPINLPLARYTISKNKLSVEFQSQEE